MRGITKSDGSSMESFESKGLLMPADSEKIYI